MLQNILYHFFYKELGPKFAENNFLFSNWLEIHCKPGPYNEKRYSLCHHSHRENLLSLQESCSHCREPVFKTGGSLHSPCCNLYWIAVYFFLLSNSKVWKYYIKESIVKKLTGVASFMQIQKILLEVWFYMNGPSKWHA